MFRQTCCQEEKKNILKKTQGLVLDWFTILWLKDKQTFSVSVASFSLNSRLVFNLIFKTHKSLQLWRNRWRRGGGAASSAQVTWGGRGDDDGPTVNFFKKSVLLFNVCCSHCFCFYFYFYLFFCMFLCRLLIWWGGNTESLGPSSQVPAVSGEFPGNRSVSIKFKMFWKSPEHKSNFCSSNVHFFFSRKPNKHWEDRLNRWIRMLTVLLTLLALAHRKYLEVQVDHSRLGALHVQQPDWFHLCHSLNTFYSHWQL